jgi:hypothetical protein
MGLETPSQRETLQALIERPRIRRSYRTGRQDHPGSGELAVVTPDWWRWASETHVLHAHHPNPSRPTQL